VSQGGGAVVLITERVHRRAGAGLQQLRAGLHRVSQRYQQGFIASAVGEDLSDMCISGVYQPGLLFDQRHTCMLPGL